MIVRFRGKKIDVALVCWILLMTAMILLPRTNTIMKLFLLGIMVFLCVIKNNVFWSKQATIFISAFELYAFLSYFIGVLHENPGTVGFLRLNIIYSLLFFVILTLIEKEHQFDVLIKAMVILTAVLGVYTILFFLYQIGYWPFDWFITLGQTGAAALHEGYTHITNTNLSMTIFLAPLNIILFLEAENKKGWWYKLLLLNFFLVSLCIVLSGRRILFGVLAFPVLYELFLCSQLSIHKKIKIGVSLCLLAIAGIAVLDQLGLVSLEGLWERCLAVFQGEDGSIRQEQGESLIKGFLENPILGSGAGVGTSYIRGSAEVSWIYELSYHLILFNSGIVGTSIYAFALICLGGMLYKLSKKNGNVRAVFCGYICALFANATNPYFSSSFDFLWFIFLPLMCVNVYSKKKGVANESEV